MMRRRAKHLDSNDATAMPGVRDRDESVAALGFHGGNERHT